MSELIGRLLDCFLAICYGVEWLFFALKKGEGDDDFTAAGRLIARLILGFIVLVALAMILIYYFM